MQKACFTQAPTQDPARLSASGEDPKDEIPLMTLITGAKQVNITEDPITLTTCQWQQVPTPKACMQSFLHAGALT